MRRLDLVDQTVTFYLTKLDGENIFLSVDFPADTAAHRFATVTLTAQCTTSPGIAKHGEIRVTASDGSMLKFPAPDIFVSDSDTEKRLKAPVNFRRWTPL